MKYTQQPVFPSLIHIIETDLDTDIKPFCYEVKEHNPDSVLQSNYGGWQSKPSLGQDNDLIRHKLYKIFNETINKLLIGRVIIDGWWININGHGSFNLSHNHPNCDLAGVYYVQVPKDSGVIYFENPHNFYARNELDNYTPDAKTGLSQGIDSSCQPTEGMLLVFPSYLRHGVSLNASQEDRISISFNLRVIG